MNPKYALKYAELMAKWLTRERPGTRDYYEQNLATFTEDDQ